MRVATEEIRHSNRLSFTKPHRDCQKIAEDITHSLEELAGCRSRASSMRGRKPAALAMLKYWAVHEADPINDAHSEIARR
ncbi:MAG: hypothetical protein QXR18_09780, partial [Pyrobaculum sp.]